MIKKITKMPFIAVLAIGLGAMSVHIPLSAQPGNPPFSGYLMGNRGVCTVTTGRNACMQVNRNQNTLDALLKKMNLNDEQKKAWDDYQALIAADIKSAQEQKPIDFTSLTPIERIEKKQQLIKERGDMMTRHLEALKTFYKTLTPAQQKQFDEEVGLSANYDWHNKPYYGRRGRYQYRYAPAGN